MKTNIIIGECDACGRMLPLRSVTTSSGEAYACAICRGGDANDLWDEFVEHIEKAFPGQTTVLRDRRTTH
jgi:hypothetical protein